ncbi:MAG: hypothetical protein Q7P63_12005 [Verrucomicrobiota bacterium JB022]|nr:hypothetical protein [Verrucomicrobiota bacterium JB022]
MLWTACSEKRLYEKQSGDYTLRAVLDSPPLVLGVAQISIEIDRFGEPLARFPLFTALDLSSDADLRDYKIRDMHLNADQSRLTVEFVAGEAITLPVFLGLPTKEEMAAPADPPSPVD